LRLKAISVFLILFIIAGTIFGALGENRTSYRYISTYTLENRGDQPYSLKEDDATFPLFQSNRWQMVRMINITPGEALTDSLTTLRTITLLGSNRSSRLIPGLYDNPAVITTISEPAVSS